MLLNKHSLIKTNDTRARLLNTNMYHRNYTQINADNYKFKWQLRGLLFYLMFAITTTIIISYNYDEYHANIFIFTMKKYFVEWKFRDRIHYETSFANIGHSTDIWKFLKATVETFISATDSPFNETRRIGAVLVRQVRMENGSCRSHNAFEGISDYCYAYYTKSNEDTKPFGLAKGEPWSYRVIKGSADYRGSLGTYGGNGYYFDYTKPDSKLIEELYENNWIDRGTRAVFFHFTLYNPVYNLFFIGQFAFERTPAGSFKLSWFPNTSKLTNYVTKTDYVIMGLEFFFVLGILYFFVKEMMELYQEGFRYFRSCWNYIELSIVICGITVITLQMIIFFRVEPIIAEALENPENTIDFSNVSSNIRVTRHVTGLLAFLIYVRILKYLYFNTSLILLQNTLSQGASGILNFTFMFFVVFIAFAGAGCILFGSHVLHFSTYALSLTTLFQALFNGFDYPEIEEVKEVMAPVFYISFILLVYFVMLNMFLAILADAYAKARATKTDINPWKGVMSHKWFPKRFKSEETWGDVLIKQGFNRDEQTQIFSKYRVTPNTPIPNCMKGKIQLDDDTDLCQCSIEDIFRLNARIEDMEELLKKSTESFDLLASKIDKIFLCRTEKKNK